MRKHTDQLAIVLVTYNRSADLAVTLTQLIAMESEYDHLIVVNNASTDDTQALLLEFKGQLDKKMHIETLSSNTGGAGGFHHGLFTAMKLNADWFWLSDDDALPETGSLLKLRSVATNSNNIYGSTALVKDSPKGELCWPPTVLSTSKKSRATYVFRKSELESIQRVNMIPFLGFMIHRNKIEEIGLPDKRFFISGDDLDYSTRVRQSGAELIQVRDSVVWHPSIPRQTVNLLGKHIYYLKLAPWRRYFEVRNRMWIANRRLGYRGTLGSLLSNLVRLTISITIEDQKLQQSAAYLKGIIAGLRSPPIDTTYE